MTAQTGNKMENSREAPRPREGDGAHLRCKIIRVTEYDGYLIGFTDIRLEPNSQWVNPADIVHIEPAPLKVGDRVKIGGHAETPEIVSIGGDEIWVRWPGTPGTHSTFVLSSLTRIEASDGAGS